MYLYSQLSFITWPQTIVAVVAGVTAAVILARNTFLGRILNRLLSRLIHFWLIRKYPLTSASDGRSIATCPYNWPNGQGDIGKFLEGERNSKIWGSTHGSVYRIWNGMTPEIVLSDPADVQVVFRDSHNHTKAINNDAGWLMGELLGRCLGLISGDPYQSVKSATTPLFTHRAAGLHFQRISSAISAYLDGPEMQERLGRGVLNPVADLRMLPFWIIAGILYGNHLGSQFKAELESLVILREFLWARMIKGGSTRFSWSQYLRIETTRVLLEYKRRWSKFNQDAKDLCLRSGEEKALIVSMYEAVAQGSMEMDQLLQTIDEMLFANLDVTMGGVSWNLLFLAAHQEVQYQIREEMGQARGKGRLPHHPTTARGSSWDEYVQSSSTMLAAAVLESARLKPLAAFTVPQSAPTARVVGGGFVVPAGTNFVVDTHAVNIANPFWGADGGIYRPSRFLGSKASSELRYQYWRFGFGPRQCLGKFVVELMVRLLVAHLVEGYRLEMTEATSWDKNPDTWIMHPDTEIRCQKLCAIAKASSLVGETRNEEKISG
ncbi:cytochrome P450 monooxygenase [Diaporthe helianthi]|uniref:Cytochrome P450 monooxygenase n=1 Tax=Diaporthe helianthi TaxID=158607 RepID=A0A2P5HYX1_DIAHE|nr:cytochrome P450 monooxygenase [Diaporthe helianthi]